ncbi:MAG: carboxypeptidase regulatory-like domain-containing protein [Vicinamibacteria bacterium]
MKKLLTLSLAILFMASAGAFAQTSTGNIYGKAIDASGAVLPGATVTVTGEAGTRTTITGGDGTFRFLNLSPSDYTVTVAMQGFGTANRKINVQSGQTASVDVSLKVGGASETVEVTAESPLVDVNKRGTGTVLTTQDLKDVPNSRDPWGIMNQVAGALVDRVNIGGNENGQQASVAGKGSFAGDRVWTLDGLVITDMSATGASPTYFDFDAFQEINVSTGGGDLAMQTGGFGMNLVTKRGTNAFHGGGRYINTDNKFESSNLPDALKTDTRLKSASGHCTSQIQSNGFRDKGDNIENIKDYGFDLGGPIIKDKLWFYGTYGKQDIKLCRFAGTADDTVLASYNFKINWQASPSTMVSGFFFNGDKQKFGRSPGFSLTETEGVLWNQANAYVDGGLPGGLWKAEINHTFSANFYMSAKAAYYDSGFGLIAKGDPTKSYTNDYASNQVTGTGFNYLAVRPQTSANIDGNYFFQGLGGNNELKFGFGYRKLTTNSVTHYNGNGTYGDYYGSGIGDTANGNLNVAYVARDLVVNYGGKYVDFFIGDTLTKDRFTFNIGARIDKQTAQNLASAAPANASFASLLPAGNYGGGDNVYDYTDISPRIGMSYALNESRKTVLRASVARYGAQLSYGNVTRVNPLGNTVRGYGWNDLNGDRFVQPNEVDVNGPLVVSVGGAQAGSSPNVVDKNLKNRSDNEFVLGVDHELASNFAVGGAFTYRKSSNFSYRPWLSAPCPSSTNCSIVTAYTANAVQTFTRDGKTYTAQTYSPNAAQVTAGGSGRYDTNLPGYSNVFKGLEFTMNKRMSGKWGGKIAASLNDWTEQYDGTPVNNAVGGPTRTDTSPLVNGGAVSVISGGSGKASFYSSFKWQIYMNAIFKLPASFDVSTAIFGRQGGSFPINISTSAGRDGTVRALATPEVDSTRYANLWNVDFRLARNSKIGRVTLSPSLVLFNAFNNDVVLSRARNAGSATFNRIEEVISPRILQLGARISF